MEDDATLFAAWSAGDREAGAKLFDRHYEAVARFFQNKAPASIATDLVQNTFLACVEARDRFRRDSAFRTFLFAVARNILHKNYRDMRGPSGRIDFGEVSVCDLAPALSAQMRAHEQRGLLLGALRQLPLECQEVLEMLYWEQMSVAEIAEVTEAPVGTVKTRLRRGRRLLDESMQRLAATPELLAEATAEIERWAENVRVDPGDEPGPA